MVANQWLNSEGDSIFYGAPVHGGQLTVAILEGKENGVETKRVLFEITNISSDTNIAQVCQVAIPVENLGPLQDFLSAKTQEGK